MRIVVIYSDTFRFDHLAAHGLKDVRTPALDALAARGADFLRCYTGSFPTGPNRADVYLGQYWFPQAEWSPLPTDRPTLAERLTKAGYVTQWIGDCPHLMKNDAFYHRGFTAAYQVRGQEGDVYFTRLNKPPVRIVPDRKTRRRPVRFGMTLGNLQEWVNEPRWEADRFCRRTTEMACRWIEDNYKHDKWVLWLELFDVHEPWDPPEYFWRRHDPHYAGPEMRHPNYGPADELTPAERRNLAAHYAGEVELLDKSVGRLLRQLEDCGIDGDTAVVFTTDHGIALGEHNRTGKSNIHPRDDRAWIMFEELAHIPLIVYLPGMRPRRLRQYVQPVDTAATILDIAGVKPDRSLHGRSVLPLVRGRTRGWQRDWAVSSAYVGRMDRRPSGLTMLYAGRWAFCPRTERMGPGGLLFDMAADREQTTNLVPKHPRQADRLRRKLHRVLVQIGTPAEVVEWLVGGRAGPGRSLPAGHDYQRRRGR